MSSELSDDELRECIEKLVPRIDLENTGLKQFVKLLSEDVGQNLKARKDFIKEALMQVIAERQKAQKDDEEDDDDEEEEESEEEEEETKPPPKKKSRKSPASSDDKPKKANGLTLKRELSPALADFLGLGDKLARTEIVKALWDYIREHDLQNPDNRKEILLDDALKQVFGCDTFTMFTMNKYISAHVHPFPPLDLTSSSSGKKSEKRASSGGGGKKEKVKRKAGTQPPYRLSEDLQAVVGVEILPRPQVVSKIWEYIKLHELQNPSDKREIICDDQLKRVMGGNATVTMFSMNSHISKHMLEKLDKSEWNPPEAKEDSEDDEEEEEEEKKPSRRKPAPKQEEETEDEEEEQQQGTAGGEEEETDTEEEEEEEEEE